MKAYSIFSLLLVLALFSCQKEIDIDLNDSNPKLVIEANYIATDSIVTVRVSKTGSYFDNYITNPVNDAVVSIRENNGAEVIVPLSADGYYELANYIPTFGATYTIKVTQEGVDYSADSKLMPVLNFLPATYVYQEESLFSDAGYWITYRFQDYSGVGNCYKLITTYGGERYDKFGDFSTGSDAYTDGNLIERPLIQSFQPGDTILLELQSINQRVYDYYSQLSSNTSSFTAAAGNPDYFWSNDALGYFSAYGYSTEEVIIVE